MYLYISTYVLVQVPLEAVGIGSSVAGVKNSNMRRHVGAGTWTEIL